MPPHRSFSSPRRHKQGTEMSNSNRFPVVARHAGTIVKPEPQIVPRNAAGVDDEHAPSSGEVQAVQVHRPTVVRTRQGETLARVGEWLVKDSDGTVRVFSDQMFRMQALHQQLSQLIGRTQRRSSKAS